ncbi:efflux RND transporter periplasmic adaptor subunit, partial [Roseobacter litoralis]
MTHQTSFSRAARASVYLAVCIALTIGYSTKAAQSQDGTNPAPKVVIAAAYSEELTREATFVGRGEASAKTDLIARVTGIITEMVVEDGASVNEGDVIFRIEPDTYQAELQAQQAAVQRADANVKLAEIELVRKTELLRREAIAESELDIAQANAAVAEADLLAAQAALREAELNLERTNITAPFDGRIGRSTISLGALVGPSTGP